jgi:hypothetical protein
MPRNYIKPSMTNKMGSRILTIFEWSIFKIYNEDMSLNEKKDLVLSEMKTFLCSLWLLLWLRRVWKGWLGLFHPAIIIAGTKVLLTCSMRKSWKAANVYISDPRKCSLRVYSWNILLAMLSGFVSDSMLVSVPIL